RMIPVTLAMPSRISMSATDSSMVRPSRGGITTPKTMIAPPTATMVKVWPMPQSTPMSAAAPTRRCRATMVVTAITWSGSVACRMPRKKPRRTIDTGVATPFSSSGPRAQEPRLRERVGDDQEPGDRDDERARDRQVACEAAVHRQPGEPAPRVDEDETDGAEHSGQSGGEGD